MEGNEKSNGLGKPADGLITPNEYTLDIFPFPLLSVGILDSKISANHVSAGR